MIDTSRPLEIRGSPLKNFGLGLLGIVMTSLCGAIAFGQFANVAPGSFREFISFAGLIFFGLCTILIFWRAFALTGPIVTLAPEGIRDIRLAAELIPWTAVRGISTWTSHGQKMMVLSVAPGTQERLTLTRIARWARSANTVLPADGLCIAAQGLAMDYDRLLERTIAYAKAGHALTAAEAAQ